jgi:hypothetical protein
LIVSPLIRATSTGDALKANILRAVIVASAPVAAVLGLICVVAADLMSRLVQKGAPLTIVVIPSRQSLYQLANTAPTGEPNSSPTKVVRSIGIDMSPTAAIPSSTPATRCDDTGQAVLMTRSIGMEGTTTTPIAAPEPHCN